MAEGIGGKFQAKTDNTELLKGLDALMEFDQSQSSKWPRVTVWIEPSGAIESDNEAALIVYPNGRPYNLERARDVLVPPEVLDALHAAMTARMVQSQNAANGYASKDVMRFPFRVTDAASQKRYDQWKAALEVVRVVVTETKKTILRDQGKVIHEVVRRYLPDEQIERARSILEWANNELQAEKDKAAELRAAAA
jgi:hypothetical protein